MGGEIHEVRRGNFHYIFFFIYMYFFTLRGESLFRFFCELGVELWGVFFIYLLSYFVDWALEIYF